MQHTYHLDPNIDLEQLASRVESVDADMADQLKDLAQALISPHPNIDTWAEIDLYTTFQASTIAETLNKSNPLLHFVELIRNALIFVPLVLTWLTLSQSSASTNYFAKLSQVATPNLFIFIVILILNFVVDLANRRQRDKRRNDERQITKLLRGTSLQLAQLHSKQPIERMVQLEAISDHLLAEMKTYHEKLYRLTEARHDELVNLKVFTDNLASGSTDLMKAGKRMETASNKIDTAVSSLAQQVDHLIKREESLEKVTASASSQMVTVAAQQADLHRQFLSVANRLEIGLQEFAKSGNVLGTSAKSLESVSLGLSNVHKEFLDRMSRQIQEQMALTRTIKDIAAQVQISGPGLQKIGYDFSAIPASLVAARDSFASLVIQSSSITQEQQKIIDQLQQISSQFRDVSSLMSIVRSNQQNLQN